MTKTEAQQIKIGQRLAMGITPASAVRAIHKLIMLGESVVIIKCDDGSQYTLPARQQVSVVA